jgi:hypothetical protein
MEVVKEFYATTTIYMHSSPLDVSAWLHGFCLPNQPSLPVLEVNENQVLSQLCFITGPSSAEWVTSLFATQQQSHPPVQCVIEWEKKFCISGIPLQDLSTHFFIYRITLNKEK